MIEIILPGKPLSTQMIYGHRSMRVKGKQVVNKFLTKEARERKEFYVLKAVEQYQGEILTGILKVLVIGYFPTMRFMDRDNRHKISMDALEGVVYEDDNQIKDILGVKMYKDAENPRIELYIDEMTNAEIEEFQARCAPSGQQTLRR